MNSLPHLVWALFPVLQAHAQMADTSLFPNTKANNPAVISRRHENRISGVIRHEATTKKQRLSTAKGDLIEGDSASKVNVNTLSLFRGGKGPRLTTEWGLDFVMGAKEDRASSSSETHAVDSKAQNYLAYVGVGLNEHVGFSIAHAGYNGEFKLDRNFAGQPQTAAIKNEVQATDYKLGFRSETKSLTFGAFGLQSIANIKGEADGQSMGQQTQKDTVVGLALGLKEFRSYHVEAGYETSLKSQFDPVLQKNLQAKRLTGTIEADFGTFAAGYTGRYYLEGYFDIERVIYDQFVYETSFAEPRLDNTFNLSFGRNKRGQFSASVYYSSFTSKEPNTFFQTGNKIETRTTSYGAALTYSCGF